MTLSLVLACLWVLVATVVGLLPEKFHWPGAYALIATGIPLVGFVTYQSGPVWGLIALAAGVSILRWPLIYLGRSLTKRRRSHSGE
ncbi:DUF2484 family protein [Rhodovulum sp. BSW8]|uniref:DUF2484 family protein n=1 Tax=Rhodovulum visakhapatnamense TaxID=364297 RepID=A0A4R8G1M9_9RHOB|nr:MULTISPECIES: DUF2484 family protein [Rhodovulum]OLS45645.1 hypothetical protein BV509_15700 [Rhodovulum sulfidophilum]MBL3568480.1 DUF2484 family protein [Rhodovulum visakhapatnamense]MBL3579500.1 DUF2484 family protein [Rhodovulum visakhapatnamense]RBO54856.1 DUF2484 family protein [Rhodovulum sp. BSW8]TDX33661.1 uncharacterized protein DUF2484 [Rhodovulum visakhapatnamense]